MTLPEIYELCGVVWLYPIHYLRSSKQNMSNFVDKTGSTVTTDVKSNAAWNMEGSC